MRATRGQHVPAVLLACVLWGTTGTVAHQAPGGSRQLVVGMSTFGFGGLLLLALERQEALAVLRHRGAWPWLGLGAGGVIAYACLYYVSMKLVGVAIGNVIALGSGPVFVTGLEVLADGRRVRGAAALATALTIAGVGLLGTAGHTRAGEHPVAGVACALGAGFGYGLYSWAGGHLITRGAGSRPAMAAMFSLASVLLVPALLAIGLGQLATPRGLAILAYLAALPMAGAYLLFGYGLRGMAASTATTLALAEPLVATLLATLVVGEHLGPRAWAGLIVIGAGLSLVAAVQRRGPAVT